jgi:hypothetical protein
VISLIALFRSVDSFVPIEFNRFSRAQRAAAFGHSNGRLDDDRKVGGQDNIAFVTQLVLVAILPCRCPGASKDCL